MSGFDISRALQEAIGGLGDLESTTYPGEYDIPYLLDDVSVVRRIREHLEGFLSAPDELIRIENLPVIEELEKDLQILWSGWWSGLDTSVAASVSPAQELFHYLRYECDLSQATQLFVPDPERLVIPSEEAVGELIQRLSSDAREWWALGPRKFEEILAEIWSGLGWETVLTPPANDGGFDLRAIRNSEGVTACYLIEAKAYRPDRPVGIDVVRHLYGVVERERVTHGILATTSRFTKGAISESHSHALKYRLSLADFGQVQKWVEEYRRNRKIQIH